MDLQKSYKFRECHFRLNDYGFSCFGRKISAVHWNHDMKMCLHAVTEIRVAARLVMHEKPRSQKSSQESL